MTHFPCFDKQGRAVASVLLSALLIALQFNGSVHGETQQAVFAMGCFWCGEEVMEKVEGVLCAESGYTGGHTVDPSYYKVIFGGTGHLEAVRVHYNASVISYEELLASFWHNVDPLQGNGQFCDRGESYQSAIFYGNDAELKLAEASRDQLVVDRPEWEGRIETEIRPLGIFYTAEANHQDYYTENPDSYYTYKTGCRRAAQLRDRWGEEAYSLFKPGDTGASTLVSGLCSSLNPISDPSIIGGSSVTGGSSAIQSSNTGGSSVSGGSSVNQASNTGESVDSPDGLSPDMSLGNLCVPTCCYCVATLMLLAALCWV